MKAWLKKWLDAAADQDKFWRDWHRQRREKRLAYYESEREKARARFDAAKEFLTNG